MIPLTNLENELEKMQKAWQNFCTCIKQYKDQFQKDDKTPDLNLDVTLYTDLEKLTDTLSKGRVRIFYKGLNRNRTFISEDFANQLIKSLPYTPVKGIFDKDSNDFEDHGEDNTDGRIYGLVMAEPNFAWEKHLDVDGVIREYACADVIYYTGLYPEANIIKGCSQSMEIYGKTLVGEWKIWEDGLPYFDFQKGCLLGLQVLGSLTEPCFEGAEFYSLKHDLQDLIEQTKKIEKKEEKSQMEDVKELETAEFNKDEVSIPYAFKLSDREKERKLFRLLNPQYNSENDWKMDYDIINIYEDYVIIRDMNNDDTALQRVYYTLNDETDAIELGERIDVFLMDVTREEKIALDAIKAANGSYANAQVELESLRTKVAEYESAANAEVQELEVEEAVEETAELTIEETAEITENTLTETVEETNIDYEAKIAELEAALNEKQAELDKVEEKFSAYEDEKVKVQQKIVDLQNENQSLNDFKKQIEDTEKEKVLSKYSKYLKDSDIENFRANMDTYSIKDFNKEVCYIAIENSPNMLDNTESKSSLYFKNDNNDLKNLSGIERLLEKHKKGGNY